MPDLNEDTTEKRTGCRKETVCFRIEGEYITDLVRDRVLEDRGDWSLCLLMEDLCGDDDKGMTYEDAVAILKGEKKLIGITPDVGGDSGDPFRLVDDTPDEDYGEQMQWHFADRVRIHPHPGWWRPYGMVTNYGPPDGRWARGVRSIPVNMTGADYDSKMLDVSRKRASFYADNADHPIKIVTCADSQGFVAERWTLWQPCEPPPIWIKNPKTYGEAFARAVAAGHRMDERGYHNTDEYDEKYREVNNTAQNARAAAQEAEEWGDGADEGNFVDTSREDEIVRLTAEIKDRAEELPTVEIEGQSIPCALIAAYSIHALRHSLPDGEAQVIARALWEPVSPVGFKRGGSDVMDIAAKLGVTMPSVGATFDGQPMLDDPWHTDLVLAGGWGIEQEYDRDEHPEVKKRWSAIYAVENRVQDLFRKQGASALRSWLDGRGTLPAGIDADTDVGAADADMPTSCVVLCGSGVVEGAVVHPEPDTAVEPGSIVVVPHAGPEFYMAAATAHRRDGAVIAETGGSLSHLAVVGQEDGFRIVAAKDAQTLYPAGCRVRVDASTGTITLIEET